MAATYAIAHDLLAGFPTAVSGKAWFYLPNTTTLLAIFGDDSGTSISNPVTLDSNGAAKVYLAQLARCLVQDVNGVTIADTVINKEGTAAVVNTSAAFTGATQEAVNNAALTAFGGKDFTYVPSGAWPGMTPQAWMNGLVRNVKAYGAKGDGVTIDDTAIAAAVADTSAAGFGTVFFPGGTYLINSAITLSNKNGVNFMGSGIGASKIKANSNAINCLTLSSCNGFRVGGLELEGPIFNTGTAISLTSCQEVIIDGVGISYASGTWFTGVSATSCQDVTITGSTISTASGGADRALKVTNSTQVNMFGGFLSSTNQAVEYLGTSASCLLTGVTFSGTGVLFNAALTGLGFKVIGCHGLGGISPAFTISTASDPDLRQFGNDVDGYTVNVAIGGNHTPDRSKGSEIRIKANSGGAGTVTVNAPTPPPLTSMRAVPLRIKFVNASGGAVTWAFAAATFIFVGGAVPANTDLHTITVDFLWDPDQSRWREVARGDTLT